MAENTIQWDKNDDGIVTLTLDDPTGSTNVMNEAYIESMGKTVERLVAEKDSITGSRRNQRKEHVLRRRRREEHGADRARECR